MTQVPVIYDLTQIIGCLHTNEHYSVQSYSTKENRTYSIVKYNKDNLSVDLYSTYGLLRSVVLSGSTVVSFSPPKSIQAERIMEKYNITDTHVIAEEFVEGTMINVFYDPIFQEWQIATRSTVGGDVAFYRWSKKTFRQMFIEACNHCNLIIETLNPDFCYSFVLQHPENRIVIPFKEPQLYLVAVYRIEQTEKSILVMEQNMDMVRTLGLWGMTTIRFPVQYNAPTYTELIEKFASPNTPYDIMGIVVKDTLSGERTKFRNPIYEEVRQLRGNQPKLQYQYLALRHSGRLPEFLKFYPEMKPEMSQFREQVHMFTNTLHRNYIACYVKKERPLKEFSEQYRTHMFNIHQLYINELRPKKMVVSNTVVIKYVNDMHPSLLMYCLNYNLRKRAVDTIKATQIP